MKLTTLIIVATAILVDCMAMPKKLKHYEAFQKMEAENYSSINGSTAYQQDSECANNVTLYAVDHNWPDSIIGYYAVDFEDGAESITLQVWGGHDQNVTGNIFLHLDDPTSTPFATIAMGPIGSNCAFVPITNFLSTFVAGIHDLYFTFSTSTNQKGVVDIDWFQFNRLTYDE